MGEALGDDGAAHSRDQVWRVLFLGAAAVLLAGLALDAWSNRYRPESDLGHNVVVIGGTIVVLGAAMLLLGPALYRHRSAGGAWRSLQVAAPVLLIGVIGPAMVAIGSASTRHDGGATSAAVAHDHAPSEAAASSIVTTPAPAAELTPGQALGLEITGNATAAAGASHDHGHGSAVLPDQPLDAATRTTLAGQLVVSRDAALTYPTRADATNAGYTMVTPFVPLIGAHYINFALVDGTFDPAKPEMLLYDGTKPDSKIVGLSYFVASKAGAPVGFAGPNDHWHQHIGLCVKGTVVVGGETVSAAECAKRGGIKVGLSDMWMVHVWVVPGWESPQGVFSPEHADLR